jgi:hypothetical protein
MAKTKLLIPFGPKKGAIQNMSINAIIVYEVRKKDGLFTVIEKGNKRSKNKTAIFKMNKAPILINISKVDSYWWLH